MRITSCVFLAGFAFALGACSRSHGSPTPAASSTPQKATAPLAENPRDISALFQVEAEHRPGSGLRVEEAFDAFREAGIELASRRQHLARPYGARYCVGAKAGRALALSVCEYVDAAAAESGASTSLKIPLANREIRQRRSTTLTVRLIESTPESRALRASLFDVFAKL